MLDALRKIPLFADLSEEDLELLAAGAYEEKVPAATVVFHEGDQGDKACVITTGEVEILKASGAREVLLAVRQSGDVIGEMALLDSAPRMATVRARTDTTFLSIPKQQMDDLLRTSATAARSLFGVLLSRWRETEASLRQSERMAQIGTLTAGLTHEMNNPAAAVSRGAGQLGAAVDRLVQTMGELRAQGLDPSSHPQIAGLLDKARQRHEFVGALERADREEGIDQTLDGFGIPDSWRFAPTMVDAGIRVEDLQSVLEGLGADNATVVVRAFCNSAETATLVSEVAEGAERLSAIVGALKSYAHLDRATVQEVDVRRGLDDTLLILKHKLGDIDVRRDYPEQPVLINAYVGELNQVWTNLIDNAADALAAAGTAEPEIIVQVRATTDGAVVEIEDNGPGIPEDVVGRVFDAFFTTKPPGSGMGLGLDISYGIVVHRHGGDISVESAPGRTVFTATLPQEPG